MTTSQILSEQDVLKDAQFKAMNHDVPTGFNKAPSEIAVGYRPDVAYSDGKKWIILESERKTDRKAFIGDLVKAEMFGSESHSSVTLIIVMKEFQNTTREQIVSHITPYYAWLSKRRADALHGVTHFAVCTDVEYLRRRREGQAQVPNDFDSIQIAG